MSLRDDSKPPRDVFFTPSGKFAKGHPGFNKGKQAQSDTQSEPDTDPLPSLDTSFDDDLIAASESFGKPRSKVGRRAYCEWLRDTRPVEFSALLRPALARKAETPGAGGGGYIANITFNTAPSGMYIDANGKLIEAADSREQWQRKAGMVITTDEPPAQPPAQPVLVQPHDEDEPPPRDDEDDGADDADGVDMNDLLRSIPKPKWTKQRW